MKKYFLYVAACMLSLGGMMSACSDGDDPSNGNGNGAVEEINITKDNASNWYSYMINVTNLLKEDAATLYDDWKTSYNGGESYASILSVIIIRLTLVLPITAFSRLSKAAGI